jgi:hypothetical protein
MEGETMMELRWVAVGKSRHLQYRFVRPYVDASGAMCPPGEWSEWMTAETIDCNDVAYEDLIASGGPFSQPATPPHKDG